MKELDINLENILAAVSNGHALQKHVYAGELEHVGVETPISLQKYLRKFLNDDSTAGFKTSSGALHCFNKTDNVFLSLNPNDPDMGSVFPYENGKARFHKEWISEKKHNANIKRYTGAQDIRKLTDRLIKDIESNPYHVRDYRTATENLEFVSSSPVFEDLIEEACEDNTPVVSAEEMKARALLRENENMGWFIAKHEGKKTAVFWDGESEDVVIVCKKGMPRLLDGGQERLFKFIENYADQHGQEPSFTLGGIDSAVEALVDSIETPKKWDGLCLVFRNKNRINANISDGLQETQQIQQQHFATGAQAQA